MAIKPLDPSQFDPSASNTAIVLIPSTIVFSIALITFVLRIYSRVRPYYRLGWDDYVMALAICFQIITYVGIVRMQMLTEGHHIFSIPFANLNKIAITLFVVNFFWGWGLSMIKTSVVLMLIRIMDSKRARFSGYLFIGLMVASSVAALVAQMFRCRPLRAMLELSPDPTGGKCWSPYQLDIFSLTLATFYVITDWVCALMPIMFIRKLNRPFREKMIIGMLMGIGMLAGLTGIIKAIYIQKLFSSEDVFWDAGPFLICLSVEQSLGIIAANIPCLRSLTSSVFKAVGTHLTSKNPKSKTNNTTPTIEVRTMYSVSSRKTSDKDEDPFQRADVLPRSEFNYGESYSYISHEV